MASTSVTFDILARDRASAKFDHLGKSVGGTSSKMSKFTGVMKTAGKAAAYGLGAGLVIAAGAAVKFTQAAVEDAEAQKLLQGALERNTGATQDQVGRVEEWISAAGRMKGFTDDDLRPAIARLSTATHDVGDALDLTRLAMDVSAGSGKSLEQVSTALMKAQNGQVSALSRLGINTKNAKGETVSMEEAVRRMSETFGGAATEKANTLSGKIDRLKLMFSEAGESLGTKLLPYVEDFADYVLNTAVPRIKKFVDQMEGGRGAGGRFKDKLIEIKDALKKVSVFLLEHKDDLLKLAAAWMAVRGALKLVTVAQLALNFAMGANPIGAFVLGVAALAGGFIYAYKHSERFRNAADRLRQMFIRTAFDVVGGWIKAKDQFINGIASMIGWVNNLIDAVKLLKSWIDSIDWGKVGKGILDAVPGMPNTRTAVGDSGKAAGEAWMAGFQKGAEKRRGVWLAFLAGLMRDQLTGARSMIADLRERRNEFANFSGFRGNLFGADISGAVGATTTKDAEGNDVTTPGPTGLAALKEFAKQERLKAQQLAADVTKLTDMGISQDLLEDLKSQGASGLAQIHALASASQEEANAIFADMAAASAANFTAGQKAATRLDEQLAAMGNVITNMARAVTQPIVIELHTTQPNGRVIVQRVKAEERATGKQYLVDI